MYLQSDLLFTISLFVLVLNASSHQYLQLQDGHPCIIRETGVSGICLKLCNCPSVLEDVKMKQPISICNFNMYDTTVCCPQEEEEELSFLIDENPGKKEEKPELNSHTEENPGKNEEKEKPELNFHIEENPGKNEEEEKPELSLHIEASPETNETACFHSEDFPGVCKELNDCPNLKEAIETGRFVVCDDGTVCCPHKNPSLSARDDLRLSEQKCVEYAKYVYVNETDGAVSDFCGQYNLIVRGENAGPLEFPHMALIGYGSDSKNASWSCGGSLISERYILTAAHCLFSRTLGAAKFVRLGVYNSASNESYRAQEYNVERTIKHPEYKPPSKYNDMALLRLDRDVNFTGYARPACLYTKDDDPGVIATGWGSIEFQGPTSDILQKVYISPYSQSDCDKHYSTKSLRRSLPNGIHHDTQMCAGGIDDEKDTCNGDSGGPIQVGTDQIYCMHSIVGVTSFGKICGTANVPGVYSRVFAYIDWIENIVWK